jgi:hypothetical protein
MTGASVIDLTTTAAPTESGTQPSLRRPAPRRGQWRAVAVAAVVTVVAVALATVGSIALIPSPHAVAHHSLAPIGPPSPRAVPSKTTTGQPVPAGLQSAIASHDAATTANMPARRAARTALHVRYGAAGTVRVGSGSHVVTMTPSAFGRGVVQPLGSASRANTSNGTSYDFGPLTAWYHQPKRAQLEQGFTVAQRPGGTAGPVTIDVASRGNVVPVRTGAHSIAFRAGGTTAMTDSGLRVSDATGRVLPSHFAVSGRVVSIVYADAGATYPVTVDPWIITSPLAPSGVPGVFGTSVAISSDGLTALVGDPGGSANPNTSIGEATVYYDNTGTWSAGTALLVPASAVAFGSTVALSANGSTAIVGDPSALGPDNVTVIGGAYVYTLSGDTWSPPTALAAPATAAAFGTSVSLSGDGLTALVGDPNDSSGTAVGEAWIYTSNGLAWSASPTGLTVPGTASVFGTSVALSASTTTTAGMAVVGDPGGGTGVGAATVYTETSGIWTAGLSPSAPAHSAAFGFAVAIAVDPTNGTRVVVGDPSGGTTAHGAASEFGFSAGAWHLVSLTDALAVTFGTVVSISENATLIAVGDPSANTVRWYALSTGFGTGNTFHTPTGTLNYGSAVALNSAGNELLIGDPSGTATGQFNATGIATYSHFTAGPGWSAAQQFNELGGPGSFGTSVALSTNGQAAVVGDPGGGASLTGGITIFTFANGAWDGGSQVTIPTNAAIFGTSVAISGNGQTVLVGDPGGGALATGAATLYTLNGKTWVQGTSLNAPATAGTFGQSVALAPNTTSTSGSALVGDPLDSTAFDGGANAYTLTGGVWSTTAVQLSPPGSASFFGASVSLSSSGTTALVGDYGNQASVFTLSGGIWSLPTALTPPAGANAFGTSVSLDGAGTEAIVGDPNAKPASTVTGGAAVYTKSGSTWSAAANLTLPASTKNFGYSVQLSPDGGTALVGDYTAQTALLTTGAANAYTLNGSTWSAPSALPLPSNSMNFGTSVAIANSGQIALVGDSTGGSLGNGAATTFNLPASGTLLAITTSPVTGGAGTSPTTGPITVQLQTAAHVPFPAPSPVTVNLATTSPGGVFSATSGGVATTSVVIAMGASSASFFYGDTVAGSPTITTTGSGLTPANQIETINPAATTKLSVTSDPTASSGTPLPVTVTAQDQFGNTTPSYTGTVHFTSSDGGASLPADYAFTGGGGDAGVHQFDVTFATGGSQSVTATDTLTNSITGTDTVTVLAGTTITPNVAPTTVIGGNTVTYSAHVTSTTPGSITGTVTFLIDSVLMCTTDPLVSGNASCQSNAAPAGSDTVTANYSGDVNYAPSTNTTTLTVNPPLSISTTSLPDGTAGVSYNQSLTATGGQAPYGNWLVQTGNLPTGTSLDASTGAITGTPTAVGTFDFTVSVTDSETIPVTVDSGPLSITVAAGASAYTPTNPYRVCDTRGVDGLVGTNAQCAGQRLAAGGTQTIQVSGTNPSGTSSGGVPASGVAAVVLNVTATGEASQGFLTVWPSDAARPTASSLNYRANKTVPNLVTVALSATGQVSFYSLQATDIVVDVEGYYAVPSGTAGLFNSANPYRICDTRGANGLVGTNAQCAGQTLSGGGTLTMQVTGTNPSGTGSGGLPATGVSAVVLNVTALGHGTGFLTVFPQGVSAPTASNLNFSSGQVVPNRVIVPVSATGQVSITTNTSVDVVVDVNGWFTDGTSLSQTGALFVPATPSRICDTRSNGNATPCVGHTIAGGTHYDVAVAGQGPVPASGVVAVVANLTATDTTAQSFLTAWPTGQSQPTASDLNWVAGLTVPNMAVVGLGTGGKISVFVNSGSADVIVDVTGWYVNGA